MEPIHLLWALGLGALASISLPLGSALGLILRPAPSRAALLAGFGAGALVAAIAVELVAPTVEHAIAERERGGLHAFAALLAGALFGGLLFVGFDAALASRGGFLRKASTAITWFTRDRRAQYEAWLKELCAIPLFYALPSDRVSELLADVRADGLSAGDRLFAEGEPASDLYFLRSGEIVLSRGGQEVERLGAGGILGELPLLAGVSHTMTAECTAAGELLVLSAADLERWRRRCPELDAGLRVIASERLAEVRQRDAEMSREEREWGEAAIAALRTGATVPSHAQLARAGEAHEGSPLAVWLGLGLDGVPESLVIGAGFLSTLTALSAGGAEPSFAQAVPYTLVAGVFLSNLPEAMSSSVGMRAQGWSVARVMFLWTALLVVTALATVVGFVLGDSVSHDVLVAIEGVAAGAAITAVMATMVPEAVHLAGSGRRVGFVTLVGFLAAVSFKLLE